MNGTDIEIVIERSDEVMCYNVPKKNEGEKMVDNYDDEDEEVE
jgi:hypothetical protein